MALLTLTLVGFIPARQKGDQLIRRTRLLLATATTILMVFFAQAFFYTYDITHQLDSNISVLMCLTFLLPAQYFFHLSALNVLRKGLFTLSDIALGPICYLIIMFAIGAVYYVTGAEPANVDRGALRYVEYGSAGLFLLTMVSYCVQEFITMKGYSVAEVFNEASMNRGRRWLFEAILCIMGLGLIAPVLVFFPVEPLHIAFWLLVFFGLFSCVIGVYGFTCMRFGMRVSGTIVTVSGDGQYEMEGTMKPVDKQRVERAVKRWMERKRFLAKSLSLQATADEMGVPRILLTEWLRTTQGTYFSKWITSLRVNEAQRLLLAHPDWDNEQVAEACGFSSRSYFQRCFRDIVGLTPSAWAEKQ